MARTSVGYITLYDVNDGTNPITAYLTNPNHTFAADSAGTITAATRQMFSTSLVVYVGSTAASYNTTTTTNNTFRITSAAYNGTSTGWGTPAVSNAGVVTVPSIATSRVDNVVLRITFSVTNNTGVVTTGLTVDVTLTTVMQGAGVSSSQSDSDQRSIHS